MNRNHSIAWSRRRLLNWLLGTSAGVLFASILYPILRYLSPPATPEAPVSEVLVARTDDRDLRDSGFKIVPFGVEPVIVIRVSDGEYRAFTATCTHLDCIVQYRQDRSLIWCHCHNGIYDLRGRNIGGPPPRPLTPFDLQIVPSSRPDEAAGLVIRRT